MANDASHSNKTKLLIALKRAGFWADDYPDLCVQWLGHAVQLMTSELPPGILTAHSRSAIYNNYGAGLYHLSQVVSSIEAFQQAASISRTLVKDNPVTYTYDLALTLMNMGTSFSALGKYHDAIPGYKEAVELCRAMSAQNPPRYNELLAKSLRGHVQALIASNQVSEPAELLKEALSLFRDLGERGIDVSKDVGICLYNYGQCCHWLGLHAEAVSAYQESIPISRAQVAGDPRESKFLVGAIHDMAKSLHALGRDDEAEAAAIEALEMGHEVVLRVCFDAPNFKSCFVCQRIIKVSRGGRKRDKVHNLLPKNSTY